MATRVRLVTDKGSDDMAALVTGRRAGTFLSLSLRQSVCGIRTDEAGLLGIERAGRQPCCPCRPEVLITRGVPGRALVSGKELFSLLHGGDFAGQTGAGPDRRGLTHNGDLGLSDDTVPVVHDVQAPVDPAKVCEYQSP